MVWKRCQVESESQAVSTAATGNVEALALREQLARLQEASRKLTVDNDRLREELQRRQTLLEKKDASHATQARHLEAADARIRELVHKAGESDYKCGTLAAKVTAAEKGRDEALTLRRALEKKLQNSQQQINELTVRLQSQGGLLEELRSVSEQRGQSAGTLEQQNRDLEAKLARAIGKLELYQGKVQTLQRQISDRETEMVLSQQKVELTLKERDVAAEELDNLRKQVKSYRESLAENEQALATSRRRLAETDESLERVRSSATRTDKARLDVLEELAATKAELDDRNHELEIERQERSALEEQVAMLEAELSEESQALAQQIADKQAELEELASRLEQALHDGNSQRETVETLRQERQSLSAELEERTGALKELKAFAERVKPAYETLKERYAELQAEAKTQSAELEALRQQLSQTENASSSLDQQHRNLEEQWKAVRAERDELELVKVRLQTELGELQAARERELQELEDAGEENGRLTDEVLQERQEHRSTRAELSEVQTKLWELQEQEQASATAIAQLETERSEMRAQTEQLEVRWQTETERSQKAEEELEVRKRQLAKLVEEVKTHQAAASKAQTNIKELLKQRSQLLEHKKQLETLLSAGGEANSVAKQQMAILNSEKEALEAALNELQADYDQAMLERDQQVTELEGELEQRQEELLDLQESFGAQFDSLEQKLSQALQEHAETVQEQEQERQAAHERESELRAALEELGAAKFRLEAEAEQAASEERRLNEVLAGLDEELQELRERHQRTVQDLHEEREQGGQLLDELAKRKSEGTDLQEQTMQLQGQIEALEAEVRARQEESSYQIAQRVALESDIDSLQGRLKELESQLDRSSREALGLRDYIEKLGKLSKERLKQAKVALATREQQVNRLREAVTVKSKQVALAEARWERTQVAESALRGALVDLRQLLAEKEEMVEELEWHLSLVYEATELTQGDLDSRTKELQTAHLQHEALAQTLAESQRDKEALQARLQTVESELEQTNEQLGQLELDREQLQHELDGQRQALGHSLGKLERLTDQLHRAQADLVEEQERSARLGAQLTDALEDRNRSMVRLRDLQEEFGAWRDAAANSSSASEAADAAALARSLARQRELGEEVETLRQQLAEAASSSSQPSERELELSRELDLARQTLAEAGASDLQSSQHELSELRSLLEEFESARDDMLEELEYAQQSQTAAESERDGLLEEIDRLRRRQNLDDTIETDALSPYAAPDNSPNRDDALQLSLDEIRRELDETVSRLRVEESARREALSALKLAEEAKASAEGERELLSAQLADLTAEPVNVSEFEEELLRGFDLGSDLVSAQLEYLAAEERKNELAQQMDQAIDLDAINVLVEELRDAGQLVKARQSEFEALEAEWNAFHAELDDTSQLLLLKFTGLIEYEMREARQATERVHVLSLELETAEARQAEKLTGLEKQLEEKDLINGELEEELAQLANQIAELSEQLAVAESQNGSGDDSAWRELTEMRQQLQEKSELLDLYRKEHESDPRRDSLEEQLQRLSERYDAGRQRIAEMLDVISERDQRLAELQSDVSSGSAFAGTLLSGSKLLHDLGLEAPNPGETDEFEEFDKELSQTRAELQDKRRAFEQLAAEQKTDENALASKRVAFANLGSDSPELRERLQLEIVVLINQLATREDEMGRLSLDLDEVEAAFHRTAEDMPAVEPTRVPELSESSEGTASA